MFKSKLIRIFFLLSFVVTWWAIAAMPDVAKAGDLEILYVFGGNEGPEIPEHVQLAADALGIKLILASCEKFPDQAVLKHVAGVVVSPKVTFLEPECLRNLLTKLSSAIPVLFPGLQHGHERALRSLGLSVTIEVGNGPHSNPCQVIVHPVSFASFFGGLRLAYRANDDFRLILPGSQAIIGFPDSNEAAQYLVKKTASGREFFLLSDTQLLLEKPSLAADNLLLGGLPYLIFFSRAGGDRVWQGSGLFANLTIDDPFLIEPYGSLSFEKLLRQMDVHRFHTTIGFIPRNFDRNEKNTVALFRNRPDRFSIAVHGNNHDRREFYRYSSKASVEPFATKPLREHEFNLTQALIRMNEFSRLTGVPYDPVIIFPHDMSPAPTLMLAKQLGYIATINGSNVPLDSEVPRRIQMGFRPYNSSFYAFLSLRRFQPRYYSELRMRADLFLGNPLFLYSHQDLFEPGIETFNPMADLINNLCSNIEWGSLGKIVTHWFLWRRIASNTFEVKMLSPVCVIVNKGAEGKHFEISKEEDPGTKVLSVMVNGKGIVWKREPDRLRFRLALPPGGSGRVVIQYDAGAYPRVIGLHDSASNMVFLWRGLAEFRDRVLSRFLLGRIGRDFLYESGISVWLPLLFVACIVLVVVGFVLQRVVRSRRGKGRTGSFI